MGILCYTGVCHNSGGNVSLFLWPTPSPTLSSDFTCSLTPSFQDPPQDAESHLVFTSPQQPLVCGGFSDFSYLLWLWWFWRVQVGYSVNCFCLVLSHRLELGEGNGNPHQYSCLENPVDGGAWWAAVHRVAQSRTRLKRLSMHST